MADTLAGRVYERGKTRIKKFVGLDEPASITQQITNVTPYLEDKVTVEIVGQPGHNKQTLYFLALAAANGIVRRIPGINLVNGTAPAYGMLAIEYDAADNWVRCTIAYRWTLTSSAVTRAGTASATSFFDTLAVYRGPQCRVVGGKFDFTNFTPGDGGVTVPGIPASAVSVFGTGLSFEGQPILYTCPTSETPMPDPVTTDPAPSYPLSLDSVGPVILSPNPKPPGDNRSRGSINNVSAASTGPVGTNPGVMGTVADPCCDTNMVLIPMVFAALSAPATNSDMRFIPPVAGPVGG